MLGTCESSPKNISTSMNEHLYESYGLLTLKSESVEDKNMHSWPSFIFDLLSLPSELAKAFSNSVWDYYFYLPPKYYKQNI